jgi:thiamine-phosphate pyrophosphorylase
MNIAPRLIAITDTERFAVPELLERADGLLAAARPGSVMLQVRDRELTGRERFALARSCVVLARKHAQYVAVNDRIDIMLLVGAAGLHLPETGVSVADARALVSDAWISVACHDPDAAASATDVQAVVLSPLLEARKGRPLLGLDALRRARSGSDQRPLLYALGGIDAERAASCLAAGADGIAAIGAAFSADPLPLLTALGIRRA